MGRIRRVRTPEGARRFGLPIGAPIVPGAGRAIGLAVPRRFEVPGTAPSRRPSPWVEDAIARMAPDLARRTREAIASGALPSEAVGWATWYGVPEVAADERLSAAATSVLRAGGEGQVGPEQIAWMRRHRRRLAELGYEGTEEAFRMAEWAVAARRMGVELGPDPLAEFAFRHERPTEMVVRLAIDARDHPGPVGGLEWWQVLEHVGNSYGAARELEPDPERALSRARRWNDLFRDTYGLSASQLARLEERFGGDDPERRRWLDDLLSDRYTRVASVLAFAAELDDARFEALLARDPAELRMVANRAWIGVPEATAAARFANTMEPHEAGEVFLRGALLGAPGMERVDTATIRRIMLEAPSVRGQAPPWRTEPLLVAMALRGDVAGIEAAYRNRSIADEPHVAVPDRVGAAMEVRHGDARARWAVARLLRPGLFGAEGVPVAERILDGADPWEAVGIPGPHPDGWAELDALGVPDPRERPSAFHRLPARLIRPGLAADVTRLRAEGLDDDRIVWVLSSPEGMARFARTRGTPEERAEAATLTGSAATVYDEARAAGADHLTAWRRALGVPESPEALGVTRPMPTAVARRREDDGMRHRELLFVQDPGGQNKPVPPPDGEKAHVMRTLTAQLPPHARAALLAVMSRRPGVSAEPFAIAMTIHQWAVSSNDEEPMSLAVQRRMQRLFGLDGAADWDVGESLARETDAFEAEAGPWIDMLVAAMYRSTQDLLASRGVRELQLWRGWRWTSRWRHPPWAHDRGEATVPHRPLSSYSLSPRVAESFATDTMTAALVPAGRILACPRTGFGCRDEQEIIVVGGELPVRVLKKDGDWS